MGDSELRTRRRLREDGLLRLRRYTTRAMVAAAGLVGVISILAATSVPGHSSAPSGASTGQQSLPQQQPAAPQQTNPFQRDPNQSQGQSQTYIGSGGGSPWAVSGGS